MNFKSIFIKILVLLAILFVVAFFSLIIFNQPTFGNVCFKGDCFKVALAKTVFEQQKGLMFQSALDSDRGMLFVFDKEGKYSFWMKHTKIPLDIIWIDKNSKVVFMSQNAQPCGLGKCPSIVSNESAMYVLEINAGMAKQIGLQIGDNVVIK